MRRSSNLGQDKLVNVDRGLFIIHYKSADDEVEPPKVLISAAQGCERDVELILHPDADQAVLWQPDMRLIVRTTAPATLRVQVLPLRANGSHAAAVKIEPIAQGAPPAIPARGAVLNLEAQAASLGGFRLLGHVAGRGDVVVGANEWVAGPSSPSRIEGIMLGWPEQPDDLDIRYAVKSIGAQAQNPRMVDAGTFSGTRGKALPISSIVMEMSGDGASDREFMAEAVFLNSPTLRATGRRVVLSGPTGREPLVGLRINIESIAMPDEVPVRAAQVQKPAGSGRVRVFRSRPRQGTSAD